MGEEMSEGMYEMDEGEKGWMKGWSEKMQRENHLRPFHLPQFFLDSLFRLIWCKFQYIKHVRSFRLRPNKQLHLDEESKTCKEFFLS